MAIGTPTALGQASTSTAATTLTITTAANAPAGAMIFLEISNHNNVVPSSVTDSAGNTYTLVSAANGTTVTATLAYALNIAALASGGTITITWSSGRNAAAAAYAVTGITTSAAADQQATNTTGSSAAPSVGPTSTTTQADELVIGLFGYSNSKTFTTGSGYTALATVESTGTIRGICGEYKIVSATGAQTADGTFNSSATYAGVLVTFKAATGGSVALAASGSIALTGSAGLSVTGGGSVALAASGSIALTGSAGLSVSGGTAALGASGTIALTGSAGLSVTGGSAGFGASGTIRITGSAGLAVVVAGGWHWTRFRRPLLDRYLNVTIAATGGTGYLGVSKDGSTYTWFSGPLGADGRTLTAVADETAAKAAAIALPTNGVWALPATVEARVFKLGHKGSIAYTLIEFYPRRLVEADDIRAESIKAIHIAAGSITGDRLYATAIDGFVITGATIQTAASGARVVLSSAVQGGFIGYGASDTYDPSVGAGTYQVLWSKADGKLYAGGGNVVVSEAGLAIKSPGATPIDSNTIRFLDGAGAAYVTILAADTGSVRQGAIQVSNNADTDSEFYLTVLGAGSQQAGVYVSTVGAGGSVKLYNEGSAYALLSGAEFRVVGGGLAVGTATGAAAGEIKAAGKIYTTAVVAQSDAGDGTATTVPGQLGIVGATNPNLLGLIGLDTTTKQLYIQALENGVAWTNVILVNNGGSVGIGSTSPSEKLAVSGNVNISGVYKNAGTQVVGTRKTGWGAPTGTATRTAFATGSVTTAQLAERVKALIDDLTSHGLIGA